MTVLKLAVASLIYVLFSAPLLLVPDRVEAWSHPCPCNKPCKATCICGYGCSSNSASQVSLSTTGSDTLTGAEFARSSFSPTAAKFDFTDKLQQLMRGNQCVRSKVLSRLFGAIDSGASLESVGVLRGKGLLR